MNEPFVPDRDRPGAFTVRVGGASQSYVDPDDPLHLEFEYMQRIADLLDTIAPPLQRLRVVHIGGAGMTLARYVVATRPTSPQIVIEPDGDLTTRVRSVLPLPRNSGIKVRETDGRTGLAAMPDAYADVIISDAFDDGLVPEELSTTQYFAQARQVLLPTGVFMINVTDRGPFDYSRRLAAGLAKNFDRLTLTSEPPILKGRRFGNLVFAGSAAELPISILQRRGAASGYPYRVVHGAELTHWIGAGRPFTDDDPGQSPDLVRENKHRF